MCIAGNCDGRETATPKRSGNLPIFADKKLSDAQECASPNKKYMLDFTNAYFIDFASVDGHQGKHLPHLQQSGKLVFLTFHLGDSLPQTVLNELREYRDNWLETHKEPYNENEWREYQKLFAAKMNDYLDANYGACILKDDENANIIVSTLQFNDGVMYNLISYVVMPNHISYVVMPNHIHFVIQLIDTQKYSLSTIIKSIKSYTSKLINQRTHQTGSIWHKDYHDRLIRNPQHLQNTLNYIKKNAMMGHSKYLYYHPDLGYGV